MALAVNWVEAEPVPGARYWTAEQWASFYSERRGGSKVVAKKPALVPDEPSPVVEPDVWEVPKSAEWNIPECLVSGPIARRLCREIAAAYSVTQSELKGARRSASIVAPRQQLIWELSKLLEWSLPQIGRFMGKDHTTILHSIRRHQMKINQGIVPIRQGFLDLVAERETALACVHTERLKALRDKLAGMVRNVETEIAEVGP